MKFKYLGTAAAEGIPALFCQCEICRYATEAGGRNIRKRSCAIMNDSVMIDFTPDMFCNKVEYSLSLAELEGIFFTHSHIDHLAAKELCYYHKMYSHPTDMGKKLNLYGNQKVLDVIQQDFIFDMEKLPSCISLHLLQAFKSVTVAGITITPLPAKHDPREECFIFLLEQDGKKMLYANDTTYPPKQTLEYLHGQNLDVVSLDCTTGKIPCFHSHMGLADNNKLKKYLLQHQAAHANTLFISHHFSHNGKLNYDDFAAAAEGTGFISSYDGMELNVGEDTF